MLFRVRRGILVPFRTYQYSDLTDRSHQMMNSLYTVSLYSEEFTTNSFRSAETISTPCGTLCFRKRKQRNRDLTWRMRMLQRRNYGSVFQSPTDGLKTKLVCRRSFYACRGLTSPNRSKSLCTSKCCDCSSKASCGTACLPNTLELLSKCEVPWIVL